MNPNDVSTDMDVRRPLELLAVLIILLSVAGLLTARTGTFHAPQIWLVALLGTFAYHKLIAAPASVSIAPPPYWHLLVVIGVALVFRLTPYTYVLGGQDEGVYVNIAMHIAHTGGLVPVDKVLAGISDPALLEQYRHGNYQPTLYVPGVYATEDGLQFQFYHLFPVWLALFADIFGLKGAGYALTLLSLASILYFQRLAHLLSGRADVGLAAALLLAINPLHAFFSKFPVTEVPTLAFSTMSFAFLLEYWRSGEKHAPHRWLAISAVAFGLLFFTRISGFMYLPIVLAIGAVVLLSDANAERRRDISLWVVVVAVLYAFSVLDGLKWSHAYSQDIYRLAFAHAFGSHWKFVIVTAVLATGVSCIAFWMLARGVKWRGLLRTAASRAALLLPVAMMGLVALAAFKAYRLGYTDVHAADPWLGKRFQLSHQGWQSVFSTSVPAAAIYLSPFVFGAGLVASCLVKRNVLLQLLLFFVTCFLGYIAVMQWSLPYQPYYARYLLSEFVPYMALFAVCAWAALDRSKVKAAMGTALIVGSLNCLVLSTLQIGKNEHEGVVESLAHLVAPVDGGDLLVVDQSLGAPPVYDLKTALLFAYDLNVATMTLAEAAAGPYRDALFDSYDEVYLLTRAEKIPTGFQPFDSLEFKEHAFKQGAGPPIETYLRNDSRVFIYKYDPQSLDATRVRFGSGHATRLLGSGWSSPEPWGVWTNARSAHLRLGALAPRSMRKPVLRIAGRAYVSALAPLQRIRVSVDGRALAETGVRFPEQQVRIDIPLSPRDLTSDYLELSLETPDAVSPNALGNSADTRLLAFGLQEAEFLDVADASVPEP